MNDNLLDNCPLCGGTAGFEEIRMGAGLFDATIVCKLCGLRLEWSQNFATAISAGSKHETIVPISISPVEAWNRRYVKEDQQC